MESNTCEALVADLVIQRSLVSDSSFYFGNGLMFLPHKSFNSASGVSSFVWDQKHAVDPLPDSSTRANLMLKGKIRKK